MKRVSYETLKKFIARANLALTDDRYEHTRLSTINEICREMDLAIVESSKPQIEQRKTISKTFGQHKSSDVLVSEERVREIINEERPLHIMEGKRSALDLAAIKRFQ